MPTTQHSALSGEDLHEPKGAEDAVAGTVYVSDGIGSGSWTSVPSQYGNINVVESDAVSVGSIGTTAQDFPFSNDSSYNGVVPDSANNRIQLTTEGTYFVAFNISFSTNSAGDAGLYEFKVQLDGTDTGIAIARQMSGSSDTGSAGMAGIITSDADSEMLTVSVESDGSADTIDVYSAELSAFLLESA